MNKNAKGTEKLLMNLNMILADIKIISTDLAVEQEKKRRNR